MAQLAHLNVLRKNTATAVTLYEHVIQVQMKTVSSNSPELLPSLDALAGLALEQKRTADAETLLHQTLSIREGSLGPMHPDVAKNLDSLGSLCVQQKKYAEAARIYERSIFLWMKALGGDNPELIGKYQKLAEVYAALNRPVDAEPLVQQVLAARESETVASLNTLASIFVLKENLSEAEPLYRLSLAILDKRGLLNTRRPLTGSDVNLDLLTQTAIEYVELLKKLRRKAEATKLEARIKQLTGKNYTAKKKAS
jgi:tetratricopeptide (TPR) repeat protein